MTATAIVTVVAAGLDASILAACWFAVIATKHRRVS